MLKKIEKKESSNQQQKNKTPELAAAKAALAKFFKDHKLDPTKDYSKDKKYGPEFKKLQEKLQKERDKVAADYPATDKKGMKKLEKQAVAIASQEKAKAKKESSAKKATKYDYPLVDGREMTSAEKKKYRQEQRNKANGVEKKAKKEEASPKASAKKEEVSKKDKSKKKKLKKEED